MDAIKTGLSVGAGTGGAVALLLAMRRQWLSERDQAHREQVDQQAQSHADRVAAAAEHDAAERRITDLYTKAADQLGSDKASVRLAGLYAPAIQSLLLCPRSNRLVAGCTEGQVRVWHLDDTQERVFTAHKLARIPSEAASAATASMLRAHPTRRGSSPADPRGG